MRNMTRWKVRKFRFRIVSEEEVRKMITNLANKKSIEIDDI